MKEIQMSDFINLDINKIQLVDVREPSEHNEFHIEGSLLIPKWELVSRINELDKDKPLYLICRVWNRSMFMWQVMDLYWFETINVLWWIEEYLKLTKNIWN